MIIQWILYDQLHKRFLYDEIDRYVVIHHTSDVIKSGTSAGNLRLHPLSHMISYAAGKSFAHESDNGIHMLHHDRGGALEEVADHYQCHHIVVMDAAEHYISQQLRRIQNKLGGVGITLEIRPNRQFLITHEVCLNRFVQPPIMESFYRWMRKEHHILMDGEKPQGGRRNYDKENRKFDPSFDDQEHMVFDDHPYRQEACELYHDYSAQWGSYTTQRLMPITAEEAQQLLDHFIEHHLDRFGELEDAMYQGSDFVHHSLLSTALNMGLLDPWDVVRRIEQTDTAINNKEGYIRQIVGRREYMYHRFWYYHESIYETNVLDHTIPLPYRFWKPDTAPKPIKQMNCVHHVLQKVFRLGYSHHIERLMVIGNFCLLIGYDPHDVNKWFWEQYIDAFERVVTPNVLGMSQYADGGKLATKPYVASANYINKMSNHCKTCSYDPKEKYGPAACPLNYLYRKFIENKKDIFAKGRQSFLLKHIEKLDMDRIESQSQHFIDTIVADA